jgi:hypothetical protein
MTGPTSRQEWEDLPVDPDLREDFGYEHFDLEAHETDDGHVLLIPPEEDMLLEDAFVVIHREDLRTVPE